MRTCFAFALVITLSTTSLTVLGTGGPAHAQAAATSTSAPASQCASMAGRSPLTGRRLPAAQLRQPLLSMKVNTYPVRAWPQRGLANLDVNFVQEIEEGYIRHMAMFATSYPSQVGPVRSSRETDLELLHSYANPRNKVGLGYSGAAAVVQADILASDRLVALTEANAPHAYVRDQARTRRSGAQHALFARTGPQGTTLRTLAAKRGAKAPRPQGWCFATQLAGGKAVRSAEVRWPRQGVAARWDAKANRYAIDYTYPANGRWRQTPALDELTGKGVTANNVVIVMTDRADVRSARYRDRRVPVPKTATVGSGELILLRDGRAHAGTWRRAKPGSPMQLLDRSGARLALKPGATWFLLSTQDRSVSLRRADAPAAVTATTSTDRRIPRAVRTELLRR